MTHPDRQKLRDMFDDRFVQVQINCGRNEDFSVAYVPCWGLLYDKLGDFVALWTKTPEDWATIMDEVGNLLSAGLIDEETKSAVDAEGVDTPDEAWAALAHWRLTGERLCERRLANGNPTE